MYDKNKIERQCLEAIKDNNLAFFSHLALYIAPTMQTLYDWEFDKLDSIKKAIEINRITKKQKMLTNWEKEEAAPVLQLAAFKLMADEDEFSRLATTKQDVKADVKTEEKVSINWPDGD